jgi:hypothetical protein
VKKLEKLFPHLNAQNLVAKLLPHFEREELNEAFLLLQYITKNYVLN